MCCNPRKFSKCSIQLQLSKTLHCLFLWHGRRLERRKKTSCNQLKVRPLFKPCEISRSAKYSTLSGSGDGLGYSDRYYLRRPRSRPARRRRRPTGGPSLSSLPQPIDRLTAILPLPHIEEDNSANLPQSGRRKRKVDGALGSKRQA